MASETRRAWTPVGHGAGRYRNDETGLTRDFHYPPTRGKWTLIKPKVIFLHIEGSVIRWARSANQEDLQP